MKKSCETIAKITRPKVRGICLRKRLFRQMDVGKDYPVTWVAGPLGAGTPACIANHRQETAPTVACFKSPKGLINR